MKKQIIITLTAPVDCTEQDFSEWVFNFFNNDSIISVNNPLWLYNLEPDEIEFVN